MATLIGIAGSLRRESLNAALLRAAAEIVPEGSTIRIESLRGIPLYDNDVERDRGLPESVETLKERIAESDGLLLATPEYNNSIPGVLKNAIDWLSRPPKDIGRVFGGKPIALIGATPGGSGTALAQSGWLPVFRTLGLVLWTGKRFQLARAGEPFDDDLRLTDEETRQRLRAFVEGFCTFAERTSQAART